MSTKKSLSAVLITLVALSLTLSACGPAATPTPPPEPLVFGMILVGPQNDHGWSQAHFEAGQYLEQKLGARMIVIDKVNPADRPATTVDQVASDMISQGAKLIFATSDDMKDGALLAAEQHPDVSMIWSSGDSAWAEGKAYQAALKNLGNIMGKMEYGKMIAGCAAALTTETGSIGYLGPLINDETRRLTNSAYLGAKYCWETYRGEAAADLKFRVNWIGFWFNIPGVTLDPTKVSNDFFNAGFDVLMSGIDTTQALVQAGEQAKAGKAVWAIPYDFKDACKEAAQVCLGVPYFNWGPGYVKLVKAYQAKTWKPDFEWVAPDWKDINNPDTSAVGWLSGPGLKPDAKTKVDDFIKSFGDGSINLWQGELRLQDGSVYLKAGEKATDNQIWFPPQLLQGMDGASK